MGAGPASSSGSNDTQVSGYEAEINKQKAKEKAQKEAFGKYDKSNTNPNNNIQTEKKKNVVTNNNDGSNNDNNNTIKQVTETAPTIAEVDQATTDTTPTETAETTEKNRLLKVKKRGRSSSIMTSAKGVTKTSSDYSLGRPSLLGRV